MLFRSLVDLGYFLGCNPDELKYHLSPWQDSAAFELTTLNELAMKFPNTTITEEMLANHTRFRVAQAKLAKRRALAEAAQAATAVAAQEGASREQAMPKADASALQLVAPSGDDDDYSLSGEIQAEIDGKFRSLNGKTAQIGDWNLIMNEGSSGVKAGSKGNAQNNNQNQNQRGNQRGNRGGNHGHGEDGHGDEEVGSTRP